MEPCIFCKIIAGEIPAKLVAETELTLAFHDISPRQPVHVLLVPKSHHRDVVELSKHAPVELLDLVQLGNRIAEQLTNGSFRLQFNTGADAGQTVFHAHAHILGSTPRGTSDAAPMTEDEALG